MKILKLISNIFPKADKKKPCCHAHSGCKHAAKKHDHKEIKDMSKPDKSTDLKPVLKFPRKGGGEVLFVEQISPELIEANKEKNIVYLFGNNYEQHLKQAEAKLKGEKYQVTGGGQAGAYGWAEQARGIITCMKPVSGDKDDFIYDSKFKESALIQEINTKLMSEIPKGTTIVVPYDAKSKQVNLGTGIAKLTETAPNFYKTMTEKIFAECDSQTKTQAA